MIIGIPKEVTPGETRVALTPEVARKLINKGFNIIAEKSCGVLSGFPDNAYPIDGIQWSDAKSAFAADIVLKINRPTFDEIKLFKRGALLICQIEPFKKDGTLEKLAQAGVSTFGMELIPRVSRSQSMDVLSSQANIAGYRSVIEAAARYGRFFPLMMTSAGQAKPAKVMVLGAGVAGLQAVATARRLGAMVEAYDVRSEVKDQILSLGAKFVELDVGEDGTGQGGYAKELSEEAKQRQLMLLGERLKKSDIIISTANIPGRKAPILITEDTVKAMRPGSVIIDMATANGGNCPLSKCDQVITVHGVILVGYTNYPAMMATDSSSFYANNLFALLELLVKQQETKLVLNIDIGDNIISAILVTHLGELRIN